MPAPKWVTSCSTRLLLCCPSNTLFSLDPVVLDPIASVCCLPAARALIPRPPPNRPYPHPSSSSRPSWHSVPPGAVGATVNVEKLVDFSKERAERRGMAGTQWLNSQADVLVCSRGGGGMLKAR